MANDKEAHRAISSRVRNFDRPEYWYAADPWHADLPFLSIVRLIQVPILERIICVQLVRYFAKGAEPLSSARNGSSYRLQGLEINPGLAKRKQDRKKSSKSMFENSIIVFQGVRA
jgi:hypothetical protein